MEVGIGLGTFVIVMALFLTRPKGISLKPRDRSPRICWDGAEMPSVFIKSGMR
ncbi:hypothetical protein ACFSC4_31505 [Deinococcus malanensis]|uniref:hypothetical protein n=1 Tax=Deinococcus malanensis TaxID=1706855 RepID=UPI003645C04C